MAHNINCKRSGSGTHLTSLNNRSRWATTTQLSPFIPIADGEQAKLSDELREAFQTADFGLDACLDIDYWREEIAVHVGNQSSTKHAELKLDCVDLDCDGDDMDDDIREVMRISLEEAQGKWCGIFRTPSTSPPAHRPKRRPAEVIEISDDDSDEDCDSLYSYPSKKPSLTTSTSSLCLGNSILETKKTLSTTRRTSQSRCCNIGSSRKATSSRPLPMSLADFDRLRRQGHGSAAPTRDDMEEDL